MIGMTGSVAALVRELKKLSALKLHGARSVESVLGGPHRFGLTLSAIFSKRLSGCARSRRNA
jgi:hypothetical protein